MSKPDQKHRSHLPMPNTGKKGLITFDAKDPASKFPPIERLRPPEGAPNVGSGFANGMANLHNAGRPSLRRSPSI